MFYEKNISLTTLPLRPNGIIISISHVCRFLVMFNIIILNVDPKMTQSIPSPVVINSFHSPAPFTFQNKKITVLYENLNVTKDTRILCVVVSILCVVVSISTSHSIHSEIDSQVIEGRKTLRFSSFTPTGIFPGLYLKLTYRMIWCSLLPNVKVLCEYRSKGWTCHQWILKYLKLPMPNSRQGEARMKHTVQVSYILNLETGCVWWVSSTFAFSYPLESSFHFLSFDPWIICLLPTTSVR
jgi:hypothetical protein